MIIELHCKELMTQTRLVSTWQNAGAIVIKNRQDPASDLAVIDLTMENAQSLIRELRQNAPELPIIAFGPHVATAALKDAKSNGASEVIARGAVVEKVLKKIQNAQ